MIFIWCSMTAKGPYPRGEGHSQKTTLDSMTPSSPKVVIVPS
jgi:hypothetical protein